MLSTLKFICMTFPALSVGLSIKYNEKGIVPNDGHLLTDTDPESCTTFTPNETIPEPQYTTLRVEVLNEDVNSLNVILVGANLGCGISTYVMPLTAAQTRQWMGIWLTCPLLETWSNESREMCSFECQCTGGCVEIQIAKRPSNVKESSWNLCSLFITVRDCLDAPRGQSGVYNLYFPSDTQYLHVKEIFCDMETDGGGWTVLLRRENGSVDFAREWEDCKIGFGSVDGEFWAGNELMHQLTTDGHTYSLRVDLESYDGEKIFAVYENFSIGPESDQYRLHVSGFSAQSTAGDCFSSNDGMMFSTVSHDNDLSGGICVPYFLNAPWWYHICSRSLLTGLYGEYPTVAINRGIKWEDPWGQTKFAKYATMMIRPN